MSELSIINLEDLKTTISFIIKEELKVINTPKEIGVIEYIKTCDVLKLLKISKPTLIDWRKRGIIPSYRIGSQIRFVKSEVLDCLEKINTIKYRS
jgi:excisionase family DNA binding protein|tara:strand:+ start:177 stop:461 length:285 start_codon:yes stop_codon:yes gene_type:complete